MSRRIYNFSAGPAMLPLPVLERVKENLLNYQGSGIGIMEMSHRSSAFEEIITSAETHIRALLEIPDDYSVLFVTGGGTQQFSMVPMNLLGPEQTANYIVTGEWAKRAWEESRKFGKAAVASSSEDKKFSYIPAAFEITKPAAYLHFTSNNTIYGTQFHREPQLNGADREIPLICDASSDLLYKKIDVAKYGLIYAAAQKNFGPAGVTVVIMRKDLLKRSPKNLPVLMDYNTHAEKKSLYNTPTTFAIYVVREVLSWMIRNGGLETMYRENCAKAKLIYDVIDEDPFYIGHAANADRSLMNVTFRLRDPNLEKQFVTEAEAAGLAGLAGYRGIGGMRASIYNAFPPAGCQALADFMREFSARAKP